METNGGSKQKKKFFQYPEEAVTKALDAISNGTSIKAASIKFGIPYATLYYKHSGKNPVKRKMGLVQWILHLGERGFPITKDQLLDSVQMLIKELKRNTPFKDDRPGRHWYESFMKRHPQLSVRASQNLTSSRSSVSEESIRNWFHEVEKYLKDNNFFDALSDPSRVFNTDESAFFLNPKGSKVIVNKGEKSVYNFIGNDEKECLTTLLTGNANGDLPPPMIIYSYERIPGWPQVPDVLWYDKKDVIKKILEPAKLNNRGIYAIDEMKNYEMFV